MRRSGYVELGEVEQACRVAGRALSAAVSAGSVRVADAMRRLQPLLLRYREVPAVHEYARQAELAARHMPAGTNNDRPGSVGATTRNSKVDVEAAKHRSGSGVGWRSKKPNR